MDIKLKSFLKKTISGSSKEILANIYNLGSYPYSLKSSFISKVNISDFFVWNPYVAKTHFIAENIRALFTKEKEEVFHCFKFFSHKGELLSEEKYKSDDFFSRIELNGPPKSCFYSSFIHYIEAKKNFYDLVKIYYNKNNFFGEQNRGYCIYYPKKSSLVGSSIHGNFGGISSKGNYLIARKRSFHLYTPAYRFKSQNSYDLVFNNPTPSKIDIQIILNSNSASIPSIQINSLGTKSYRLNNFSGSITFRSRLPICRPILFKNTDRLNSGNFDVLHS